MTGTFSEIKNDMKVPDKKFNDISERDIELTQDQIHELKRRIKDHENPVRYVIYSEIIPNRRWWRCSALRSGATRCRIVECTQIFTLSTRHVPAGPYAGVLAT